MLPTLQKKKSEEGERVEINCLICQENTYQIIEYVYLKYRIRTRKTRLERC